MKSKKEYKQLLKEANGYCRYCNRPSLNLVCSKCKTKILYGSLDANRISLGVVFKHTINFQQTINRQIIGCNAPYKYRGLKEDRYTFNIPNELVDKCANQLDELFTATNYVMYNKRRKAKPQPIKRYKVCKHFRPKLPYRILINIILFHLARLTNKDLFYDDDNFNGSLFVSIYQTMNIIMRQHQVYNTEGTMYRVITYTYKEATYKINNINKIVEPIMNILIDKMYS